MGGDRTIQAQNESLIVSVLAAVFFVFATQTCQPTSIKNKINPKIWVAREEATVCISVDNDSLLETIEAVKAWDTAIGKWRQLIPVVGSNETCNYIIKEVDADESVGIFTLASTHLFGREIKLYKNRYELDVLGVVLHELGHVLGAKHLEGTLMAPHIDYGRYKCPDAPTVAQVAMANGVDPSTFNWCKTTDPNLD